MTVSRRDIDRAFDILRGPAPPEYTDLDVYPALDDDALAMLDPLDSGKARAFIAWSKTADSAFDSDGPHRRRPAECVTARPALH